MNRITGGGFTVANLKIFTGAMEIFNNGLFFSPLLENIIGNRRQCVPQYKKYAKRYLTGQLLDT